jgi:hypothetical protein
LREITLNRQKLGLEDLAFGTGTEEQVRAGIIVTINKINAGNLPFDETRTLLEFVQDANIEELGAIVTKLSAIGDNLTQINATFDNLVGINSIVSNLSELLLVNDNAAQVASDKVTVANDKTTVLGYKDAVNTMKLAVETIYDTFDDRFLGSKVNDPIVDNDGNALIDGAMYFNTSSNTLKVYDLGNTLWVNIPQIYLSGLLDVTLTSITTGDILTWNGSKWINTRTPSFDSLKLNGGAGIQGTTTWNNTEYTYDLVLNPKVTLQVGQEELVYCKNNTASLIANGRPVMAVGTNGNSGNILVDLHDGTKANARRIIGIATEDLAANGYGFVTRNGKVRGLNTTGSLYGETWVNGDILYVKATGALTKVEPADTSLKLPIAFVIHAHTNGTLYVRTTGMDENHDRDLIATKVDKVASTDNAIVRFDGATGKLQNSSVTIDDNGNIGTGTQTFNGFGGSGFKNYIINGNFDIDQYKRGTQSNWNSTSCYTDRFLVFSSSNVLRNGAGYNNPIGTGLHNHLSITKTAGSDTQIVQKWEIPKDKAKQFLNGRTLTFSCWVLAETDNFVETLFFIKSGASANSDEVKAFNITKNNVANIWTRVTGTITNIQWTYEAGEYIAIRLDPVGEGAGELHTTGWQLEEGSVATPFENRPYGLELSLCQRYYETSGNARIEEFRNLTTGILQYGAVRFMVEKRITPSIVVMNDSTMVAETVGQDNGSPVSVSISNSGTTGFRLHWTNTASRFGASFHYTASAEL